VQPQQPSNRVAFTISEFCFRNSISPTHYHKLKREGRAPREMALGRAIRISLSAEEAWRRARELPDDTEARLIARESKARECLAKKAGDAAIQSPRHISKRHRAPAKA
jgi:hypothetical protein